MSFIGDFLSIIVDFYSETLELFRTLLEDLFDFIF